MAFDTHETVKDLTSAGFSEPQAEALTRAVQAAAAQIDLADLATKLDLSLLRHDLAQVEVATKQDVSLLRQDLSSLRHDLSSLEASTKHELALVEARFDTYEIELRGAALSYDVSQYFDNEPDEYLGLPAAVSIDPAISIDPTFADTDQFQLVFSPDVGNSPTSVPEPPTFALFAAALI